MKSILNTMINRSLLIGCLSAAMLLQGSSLFAQDDTTVSDVNITPVPKRVKPVKNTFESIWLIDNQTVMVPVKGTLEMDIMHRFGTVTKGYEDFWGFFAPSNIRLGVNYAPIKNLFVGIGITKGNMLWDLNGKYSIITQTKGAYPVSVSFYSNLSYDTRKDADNSIFKYRSQRVSFFNQLLIARKLTDKLSVQVAPSLSHQNSVNGYYTKNDSTGQAIFNEMKFDHFAIAFSARYKVTNVTSVMLNYDQPLTKHATNNPSPNLSFGVEFNTSGHSFQLFLGNYSYLNPQRNNLFNTNSPFGYTRINDDPLTPAVEKSKVKGGQFLIGFNITRLWN